MPLVDLRMTKRERQEEQTEAMSPTISAPEYPYGTCLNLDTDELDKLGIKDLPKVGDEYHIHAIGRVTRVSSSATEGDERNGMEVQITMMEMVHEDEHPGEESESTADELAESAEMFSVSGRPKTLLTSAYRGRR